METIRYSDNEIAWKSSESENKWSGFCGYLVTAEHRGKTVHNVALISAEKDYSLTDSERRKIMHNCIRAKAFDKFGRGVEVTVTWVKGKASTLIV